MRTRLHSLETYLYKYVLPIVFIPWDGFRGLRTAFPANTTMFVVLITVWAVMVPFVFWNALKLKTVAMDDQGLHVKGYFKEIDVPFVNVASIKPRSLFVLHVTLLLNMPTEFGDRIAFMARSRIDTPEGRRPTLEELQKRIARSQS